MSTDATPSARQRWLIPVLVVVLSVTVGAGLLAREVYHQPDAAAPPADGPVAVASTPSTSRSPQEEPGSDVVAVTPDVAAYPGNEQVRMVVQTYFSSINLRDYARWTSVASHGRVHDTPPAEWKKDFQSTRDGSILIYRIEPGAQGSLRVLLGFTSTQAPEQAPDGRSGCIRWQLVMPLVQENGFKVDRVTSSLVPEHQTC